MRGGCRPAYIQVQYILSLFWVDTPHPLKRENIGSFCAQSIFVAFNSFNLVDNC